MIGRADDGGSFVDQLHAAYRDFNARLRRQYNRNLPFQDAMFDRWERAKELGFGEGASIYNSAIVYGDVRVGPHSWIGPYVVLDGSGGGLAIGEWCSISAGVHIFTHDTVARALSGGRCAIRQAPVSVGDRCYIGSQAVIAAGVTVGSGCVIASNSFVNRDVASASIVGGTPARPIGRVEFDGAEPRLVWNSGRQGAKL